MHQSPTQACALQVSSAQLLPVLPPASCLSRYRVQQLPVVLVASSTCQAQHPQLQSTAAALNCQLTTSWPPPAAGGDEQEGGGVQAYCVVAPSGELLTPAVLRALTTTAAAAEGCSRLVTPAWLEAVSACRAWPGELPAPNQQPEHSPASFVLPGQQQQHGADAGLDEQQQQQLVQLSSWSGPGPQLLSGFMLVFGKGCQVRGGVGGGLGTGGDREWRQLGATFRSVVCVVSPLINLGVKRCRGSAGLLFICWGSGRDILAKPYGFV